MECDIRSGLPLLRQYLLGPYGDCIMQGWLGVEKLRSKYVAAPYLNAKLVLHQLRSKEYNNISNYLMDLKMSDWSQFWIHWVGGQKYGTLILEWLV